MIRAARPSCFFHGFSLSKFFPWERYGFESCAFNSEVKKKRKRKTPQIVWSMTETEWGERIIPSKTNRMRYHISKSSIIQSGGATVGRERLAPCWRNARTNGVGFRGSVCRNSDLRTRPIKKFSTGAAARSENSESFLAACSGSGSFSLSGFSLPDATGAHNVHQCVCV